MRRAAATPGPCIIYDASGRTLTLFCPTTARRHTHTGNTVTVTDPAGKWKTFTMDAFGNLVSVAGTGPITWQRHHQLHIRRSEPPDRRSMPRGTTTQTRTFNYNSGTTVTGFLQSATNPENGRSATRTTPAPTRWPARPTRRVRSSPINTTPTTG